MNSFIERLAFHRNGRPRGWVRTLLFRRGKKVRAPFRRIVFKKSGTVRPEFADYLLGDMRFAGLQKKSSPVPLQDWLGERWQSCSPLTIFPEQMERRRITVLTDSIGPSSLFGGVGTSLILGALWAARSDADLRIVTRTEAPDSTALRRVLTANGLDFQGRVEFRQSETFKGTAVPVGDPDLFLSTSWWSTRSLLDTVGPDRTVYLLQEDERLFYPNSDDHVACSLTLAAPLRRVVINTALLHGDLTEGPHAISGLSERSVFFEPAFPLNATRQLKAKGRRQLFFYARPANSRNLFATGIAAIGKAVETGRLDPQVWELHMIGNNLPDLIFPGGLTVVRHKTMDWARYQQAIAGMDAGFVLQYTPHPSYPPLDLASVGLPVLTNSYGVKRDLSAYSANILSVEPNPDALAEGFGQLTALALDEQQLETNRRNDRIGRDWAAALEMVVEDLDTLWAAPLCK